MTETDKKIFSFIKEYIVLNGYSPAIQDIKEEIGLSKSVIHNHLINLQKNGFISREPGKSRTIRIVKV